MSRLINYESGLRAVVEKIPQFYTVSFGVFVNVGSSFENKATNGYSHFVEHMLFKGTNKRTSKQIAEGFENIGANVNAFTSKDSTCYFVKCFKEDLKKSMELFSDMFFDSSFETKELESERKVILEEISMTNDMPDETCFDLSAQAIFGKQKIAQKIAGTEKNIKKVQREDLLAFKQKFYNAKNVVLSVAGNFDEKEFEKYAMEYFENRFAKNSKRSKEEKIVYEKNVLTLDKECEQGHLTLAYPACALTDKDIYTARLLNNILGGGMSSRLFQTIREKRGLAYSVYSFLSSYSNCGCFQIYVATQPSHILSAKNLIQKELLRIVQKGVTIVELKRAKEQIIKGFLTSLESNRAVMSLNAKTLLKKGTIVDVEKEVEFYAKVSQSDIHNLAMQAFKNENCAIAYVGKETSCFSIERN